MVESTPGVEFPPAFLITLSVLCVMGAMACAVCASHFLRAVRASSRLPHQRRQRRSIALLLLMDSAVSGIGCLWQSTVLLSLAAIFPPSRLLCSVLMVPCFGSCFFGTAYMSAVAAVRYATIDGSHSHHGHNDNKSGCGKVFHAVFKESNSGKLVFLLTVILSGLAVLSCGILYARDLPVSLISEMCYRQPDFNHRYVAMIVSHQYIFSLFSYSYVRLSRQKEIVGTYISNCSRSVPPSLVRLCFGP